MGSRNSWPYSRYPRAQKPSRIPAEGWAEGWAEGVAHAWLDELLPQRTLSLGNRFSDDAAGR